MLLLMSTQKILLTTSYNLIDNTFFTEIVNEDNSNIFREIISNILIRVVSNVINITINIIGKALARESNRTVSNIFWGDSCWQAHRQPQ